MGVFFILDMQLETQDILVSGIGTALFYSAFLPFGSVCINTGWKDWLAGCPPVIADCFFLVF